jgi:hypothetical protein
MGLGSFLRGGRDDGGKKKVENLERKAQILYSHETQPGAQRPLQDYPETGPNAQASSRNTGSIGGVLDEHQQNKTKKSKKRGPIAMITRKPVSSEADRDKKVPEQRDHDDIDPNKSGPPIGNTPSELGLVPYSHPSVANVGENSSSFQPPSTPEGKNTGSGSWLHDDMASRDNGSPSGVNRGRLSHDRHASSPVANVSEPLQGEESQGIETRHEEEDSGFKEVRDRISRRLYKFKRELSPELSAIVSTHFDREIPRFCSLEDIGMVIDGLIKALQSSNQDAHDIKKALGMKTTECESLTKSRDEWAQEKKKLEDRVSTLKRDKEREKENCIEATRLAMKAEHKEAQEEQQSAWQTKENDYRLRLHEHEGAAKQLEQQHKKRMSMLLQEHKTKEDGFNVRIRQLEMEKETWEKTYNGKVAELGQLHQTQITSLRRDKDREIKEITSECDDTVIQLEDLVEQLKSKHVGELNQLRLQYQEHMQAKDQQYEMDKKQMATRYHNDKAATERNLKATINHLYAEINAIREGHGKKINEKDREIVQITKDYEAQKTQMRDAHEAQQRQMRENHNAIVVALGKQREEEQRSLREQNQSLKGALVNRDGFKAMSDHKLASRFQELTSDVDAFARVQWDIGRVRTWPFPDTAFLNSENQRMDKQYLVQNTIWVILYKKIFFTPFRVLGKEGKSLEQQWMASFGQGKHPV